MKTIHLDILACFDKSETTFIVGEDKFRVEGNTCSYMVEKDDNGVEYFSKINSFEEMILLMRNSAIKESELNHREPTISNEIV